jgi:DNA-binding CsgD family transcriptional regulator
MLENPGLLKRIRELGVLGVVSKRDDLAHIGSAVRSVMRNAVYIGPAVQQSFDTVGMAPQQHALTAVLSKREFEVVRLYVAGSTIKEIALALSRSIKTISTQKSAAMRKLGVERDSDLHQYALSHGLANVSLPGEEPAGARHRAQPGSPRSAEAGTEGGAGAGPGGESDAILGAVSNADSEANAEASPDNNLRPDPEATAPRRR